MEKHNFIDYKRFIFKKIELHKKTLTKEKGILAAFAQACNIKSSYLSRVFNTSNTHLNADQIYLACKFLELNSIESEYVHLLYDLQHSKIEERRSVIELNLLKLKNKLNDIENNIVVNKQEHDHLMAEKLEEYYLNPDYQIVHMLLCIAKYKKNVTKILEVVGISLNHLNHILNYLLKLGIIEKNSGEYKVIKDSLHLSKNSKIFPIHLERVRLKTISKLQNKLNDNDYNFSVYFSTAAEKQNKIKEEILCFIQKLQKISISDKEEELFQLTLDFLKWS